MPNVEHIGVSRRIPKDEERARLKEIMKRIRHPGHGYIVRTVSEGVKEEDLRSDVEFLGVLWQEVMKKRDHLPAPNLLHTDLSLAFRVVRDLFTTKVERLWVDSREEYDAIRDFVRRFLPEQASRVHYYDKEESLFDHMGIEMEISRAINRKVWLKSGGHIVVDHTEAMAKGRGARFNRGAPTLRASGTLAQESTHNVLEEGFHQNRIELRSGQHSQKLHLSLSISRATIFLGG